MQASRCAMLSVDYSTCNHQAHEQRTKTIHPCLSISLGICMRASMSFYFFPLMSAAGEETFRR
jgi:hypothetical protein